MVNGFYAFVHLTVYYAPANNFAMKVTEVPRVIDALMEKLSVKQAGLAKRLGHGVTQPQVSRWLNGVAPETANLELIAALAEAQGLLGDVRSEDVAADLAERPQPRRVKLKGYVGAGSEAHFYRLADEEFETVEAPDIATDQTVAVEIKGTSFGPLMESWLVFYDDVHSPVTPQLVGRTCVVGLADDRILIKKIVRNRRGGYDLLSNSSELPIEDVEIEWAALVTDMRPRR